MSSSEEVILVYDAATDVWSYEIKPLENTFEILAALPDNGGIFFQSYALEGKEIFQFDSEFQLMRRIDLNARIFQGLSLDGRLFLSTGGDYSDISIIDITAYPPD